MNVRWNSIVVLASRAREGEFRKPSNSVVFKFVQVAGRLEFRTSEHRELLDSKVCIDNFSSFIETKIHFAGRQ